jgi:glutamate synthase domain-containing protein 3
MATPFRIKRSAVPGKKPVVADLQLGELALNTYDGYLFSQRDTGGVGIGTTVSLLTPWIENYGGQSIYYNQSVGIGTTNATSKLTVVGDVNVSGAVTATELIGGGSELRNLSGTHLVSYASHSETSNSALSIAGISTYNQVGILTGSLAVDGSDFFGISVATSADGKTIIVGANNDKIGATYGTGVVYVYDRVGSSFNQVGILTGSLAVNASDGFGSSVATSADGKTIIVGASSDEQTGSGADSGVVYVYDRVGSSFNQVGILTGSLAVNASDNFGISVATSADGKTIVVGAYNDEIGATLGTGVVYVYDRVGSSFNQVGILTGSLAVNASDGFGYSVATSADGKTIVVGAYNDEIGATSGTGVVYVFNRQGNNFNQVGILTGSLAVNASDFFGSSVATSADGKTIIVGAYDDEIGATLSTGVVYVYDQTRDTYVHSGPTGNIGIGTTSPQYTLDVGGDINTTTDVKIDGISILTTSNNNAVALAIALG